MLPLLSWTRPLIANTRLSMVGTPRTTVVRLSPSFLFIRLLSRQFSAGDRRPRRRRRQRGSLVEHWRAEAGSGALGARVASLGFQAAGRRWVARKNSPRQRACDQKEDRAVCAEGEGKVRIHGSVCRTNPNSTPPLWFIKWCHQMLCRHQLVFALHCACVLCDCVWVCAAFGYGLCPAVLIVVSKARGTTQVMPRARANGSRLGGAFGRATSCRQRLVH